jgi:hypothetical protein
LREGDFTSIVLRDSLYSLMRRLCSDVKRSFFPEYLLFVAVVLMVGLFADAFVAEGVVLAMIGTEVKWNSVEDKRRSERCGEK